MPSLSPPPPRGTASVLPRMSPLAEFPKSPPRPTPGGTDAFAACLKDVTPTVVGDAPGCCLAHGGSDEDVSNPRGVLKLLVRRESLCVCARAPWRTCEKTAEEGSSEVNNNKKTTPLDDDERWQMSSHLLDMDFAAFHIFLMSSFRSLGSKCPD